MKLMLLVYTVAGGYVMPHHVATFAAEPTCKVVAQQMSESTANRWECATAEETARVLEACRKDIRGCKL